MLSQNTREEMFLQIIERPIRKSRRSPQVQHWFKPMPCEWATILFSASVPTVASRSSHVSIMYVSISSKHLVRWICFRFLTKTGFRFIRLADVFIINSDWVSFAHRNSSRSSLCLVVSRVVSFHSASHRVKTSLIRVLTVPLSSVVVKFSKTLLVQFDHVWTRPSTTEWKGDDRCLDQTDSTSISILRCVSLFSFPTNQFDLRLPLSVVELVFYFFPFDEWSEQILSLSFEK